MEQLQFNEDIKELEEYVKKHIKVIDRPELEHIPLVINAYGGPCSGKSTTCLHLVAELKKLGYKAEYVSEYAKELVYDNEFAMLDGSLKNQSKILLEQNKRVERLVGNVDFIVSDSPILLSPIYTKKENKLFNELVKELNEHYIAFSFFVERDVKNFKTEGRIHNLEESVEKDNQIKQMLLNNNIFYGTYTHDTVDKIINNCIKTFNRINDKKLQADFLLGNGKSKAQAKELPKEVKKKKVEKNISRDIFNYKETKQCVKKKR